MDNSIRYLVHFTTDKALQSIVRYYTIFNGSDRDRMGIKQRCNGSIERRRTSYLKPLEDSSYYKSFDEADGVYFRVNVPNFDVNDTVSTVKLIFSPRVLDDRDWILNTEENNGFVFYPDNSESPFTGEIGKTYYSTDDLSSLSFDPYRAELLITRSVDLEHLVHVQERRC